MVSNAFAEILGPLHLLQHPFYRDWMEGKLSSDMLKDYASQYYEHVKAFPRYLSAVHSLCDEAQMRQELLENLNDEEGLSYGISHPEYWLRFAEGLGLDRNQVQGTLARAAIKNVVTTFFTMTRSSLAEGLGAIYAYESQVPEIAESKIEGLKAHYGVHDERSLDFFEVHKTADVYHRDSIMNMIQQMGPEERAKALGAAEKAARSLWDFLTDIHERKASA